MQATSKINHLRAWFSCLRIRDCLLYHVFLK